MDILTVPRNSYMEIGNIYFWTATINNWNQLLNPHDLKDIIINSLRYLSDKKKIKVYGFVVMPNHIHLIWELLEKNGKENAHVSFLKFTAHEFKKYLQLSNPLLLLQYAVDAHNKAYEFWQRDSMAFLLVKRETALQKLEYIHTNPMGLRWNLCDDPVSYHYSSARFYTDGVDEFGFLHHLSEVF
jgi:putative transposase